MNMPSPIRARGWISIPVSAREKYAIARGATGTSARHERVRDAVHEQRVQAGPLREDLGRGDLGGRGVALAHGGDVAAQLAGDPADGAQTQHLSEGYSAPQSGQSGRRCTCTRVNSSDDEVDGQERVQQRRLRRR